VLRIGGPLQLERSARRLAERLRQPLERAHEGDDFLGMSFDSTAVS
jgi:hypothetical protein